MHRNYTRVENSPRSDLLMHVFSKKRLRMYVNSGFLLQAAVVNSLHLNADLLIESAEHLVSCNGARAMLGAVVLVRIEAHIITPP